MIDWMTTADVAAARSGATGRPCSPMTIRAQVDRRRRLGWGTIPLPEMFAGRLVWPSPGPIDAWIAEERPAGRRRK